MSEVAVTRKPGRPKKKTVLNEKAKEALSDIKLASGASNIDPMEHYGLMEMYDRKRQIVTLASDIARIMIQARGGKAIPTVPLDSYRLAKQVVDLSYDGEEAAKLPPPGLTNLTADQIAIMGGDAWGGDDE